MLFRWIILSSQSNGSFLFSRRFPKAKSTDCPSLNLQMHLLYRCFKFDKSQFIRYSLLIFIFFILACQEIGQALSIASVLQQSYFTADEMGNKIYPFGMKKCYCWSKTCSQLYDIIFRFFFRFLKTL